VEEIVAKPGSRVAVGDLLIRASDPILEAKSRRWKARIQELEVRFLALRSMDVASAEIVREELAYSRQELARVEQRLEGLQIRSLSNGSFVIARDEDWVGRFVHQGELIAHVIDLDEITVRTVVSQDDADLVRFATEAVDIRLAERIEEVRSAEVVRIVPSASDSLPSAALGTAGGGEVPSDPRDPAGARAMTSFFEVELSVSSDLSLVNAGGRVYVRFDHGFEPLAVQWYRQIRQLFLSRFQV
jgi:putative peptide zinc metalloprotease protein